MAIALVAFDDGGGVDDSHHRCRSHAAAAANVVGVVGGSVFHRQTPDGEPSSDTLGNRGLVVYDLAPNRDDYAVLAGLESATGGRALGALELQALYRRELRESDIFGAAGILVVLLNNASPDGEEAFVEWYDRTHLREVVDASPFWIGSHYEVVTEPRTPTGARHLGLLETDMSDAALAHKELLGAWPAMSQWPHELVHCAAYVRCTA
jgi:hypothetical protein